MHPGSIRPFEIAWVIFGVVWLLAAISVKPVESAESAGSRMFHVITNGLAFVLIFWERPRFGPLDMRVVPLTAGFQIAAVALTYAGIAFAIWARFYLGGNWSGRVTLKQDHTLIQSGPYALVRHPIYTGMVLAALGTAIGIGQLRCFVGVGLAFASWLVKSRTEEALLITKFGEKYEEYRRQVKAIIPFVF